MSNLFAAVAVVAIGVIAMAMASEVQELDQASLVQEPAADMSPAGGAAPAAVAPGGDNMAAKASAKAELALGKIQTAKELREKARAVLTKKGKPIPSILKKGALDDIHQRVLDAQQKLSGMPAAPAPAAAAPGAVAAISGDNGAADATAAKAMSDAEEKKAKMYKKQAADEKKKAASDMSAEKAKQKAAAQKSKIDQQMKDMRHDQQLSELEMKMKEKAEQEMASHPAEAPESEADFNHRQIAQEAYNKQVMGYVMSWEKTHGGPQIAAAAAGIKNDLEKFVEGYEQAHSKITNDVAVADP